MNQALHTQMVVDPTKEHTSLCHEILEVPGTPRTNMPLAFSHLVGHYDTQYCMYMWSEMYSMDMFHMHFKQEGILIGKVRMDYRS